MFSSDSLENIAEQKIREAQKNGLFDKLPGKGRPLKLDDMEGVPEELRMAYKVLNNSGVLPEELQSRKEMTGLQNLLAACDDPAEQLRLRRELMRLELRQSMQRDRRRLGKI